MVLCIAAVSAVAGVVALQSNEGDVAPSVADDSGEEGAGTVDEAIQGCVDSWNDGNRNKGSVASIATAAQQTENPTAYVNVGSSAVFPDRCMITVANSSTLYAQQYLQDTGDGWSIAPAWTGTVNDLDSSNLPWNARMAQDGTIIIL